jgi:cytochrome c
LIYARVFLVLIAFCAATPALAEGDVEAGQIVFKKCLLCHTNEAGKNKIGPSLFGIIGRQSATIANYFYSPAMKSTNWVWDEDRLFAYLADPKAMVPGTKMLFPGLPSEKDRHDVIAYLATLK